MIWKRLVVGALLCLSRAAFAQSSPQAAEDLLKRLMPQFAPQIHLTMRGGLAGNRDGFRISGTTGHIEVEALSIPTLLYGVNWYLKYVAHVQVYTNGVQLGPPGLRLPAPPDPIEKPELYRRRYALNENVDGYSMPYWDQKRWQREIDILALSGINAVLIERGTDFVFYQTFRDVGYSDEAIRRWIT